MTTLDQWLAQHRQKAWYLPVLAVLSGVLLGLSWHPPLTPLIFLALVPLLEMLQELSAKEVKRPLLKVWGFTYLAFILWNVVAYWWLWYASGWATLGAWFANAFLQALPVLFFFITKRITKNNFGIAVFAVSWLSFEYLHLHWDLSWVWLNLGNVFGPFPAWVQWYSLTGAFGGSLWVLLTNIAAFQFLKKREMGKRLAFVLLFPLLASYVVWFTYEEQGEAAEVVVVQPNIDCYNEKFTYNSRTGETNQASHVPYEQQVARLMALSAEKITPKSRFLLWPETAMHRTIDEDSPLDDREIARVKEFVGQYEGLTLVTGIDSYKIYGNQPKTVTSRNQNGIYYDLFNTAMLIDDTGELSFYNKSQLVIGAETTPFPKLLRPLVLNFGGSSGALGRQDRRVAFGNSQGQSGAPVICYESAYGEFVTEYIQAGAQSIFVITNDGWWNDTPGHKQHLYFSSLRAIETRRSVARSANTGISCYIDQRGQILGTLGYGEMGALAGTVYLHSQETYYVRFGDYLGRLSAFLAVFMFLGGFVRNQISRSSRKKKK